MGEAGGGVDAVPGVDGADAGTRVDSGADLGNMTTKYMAQLPDAGRDLGVAPLYGGASLRLNDDGSGFGRVALALDPASANEDVQEHGKRRKNENRTQGRPARHGGDFERTANQPDE
jgi:hypothetical protein